MILCDSEKNVNLSNFKYQQGVTVNDFRNRQARELTDENTCVLCLSLSIVEVLLKSEKYIETDHDNK